MAGPIEDIASPGPTEELAGSGERLALLAGFCLGSLGWNVCWPFLPLRVAEMGVTDPSQVARLSGLLAGVTNLLAAVLGPIWSTLGERYGYRLQILRAHTGTAFSMVAMGLARGPVELAGATIALGCLGGNYPHYMAIAASRTAASEVGRVVGDLQAAGQIGGTIGPLVGGLAAARYGLPASFAVGGAISLVAFGLIVGTVRPDRRRTARPVRGQRGGLREAFARSDQRALMLLMLVGDSGIQGLRQLIPILISTEIADSAAVATMSGVAATLATGASVVSALAVGRISQRVSPRVILLVTMPVGALFAALIPLTHDLTQLITVWTLTGLAAGATTPSIFAWLGRLSPGGGGFALLASTSMLGFAIGPALMGQVSVYGLAWPFWLAAGLTSLGTLLVVFVGPRTIVTPSVASRV